MYFVPQCRIVCRVMPNPESINHVSECVIVDFVVVGITWTVFTVDAQSNRTGEIVEGIVVYFVVLAFYV